MKNENTTIDVVVEIPSGSRNKYEINHNTGDIYLDRVLYSSVHYPADYGYVPDTESADGDPLDALIRVLASQARIIRHSEYYIHHTIFLLLDTPNYLSHLLSNTHHFIISK